MAFFPKNGGSPVESHKDLFCGQYLQRFKAKSSKGAEHLHDKSLLTMLKAIEGCKSNSQRSEDDLNDTV